MSLSVIMLTSDSGEVLKQALESIEGLWDELIVGDAGSTDGTREILTQYKARIVEQKEGNLGARKQELVRKAKGEWILVLDSDERVSEELYQEIKSLSHSPRRSHGLSASRRISLPPSEVASTVRQCVAYRIPYQNYVFGKPVYYGGEKYSKVRMFRKGKGRVETVPLHEEVIVTGRVGDLHGVLLHHSYRSVPQLFGKFTQYAITLAREKKKNRERPSLQKLFLYGPHMFWARFISDQGYKDGLGGFVLAIAFFYMETLTYWLLLFK